MINKGCAEIDSVHGGQTSQVRKMLRRTLTYENLNVLTAGNGLEALPLVKAHQPDLIILDWMMPKMDGLTFVQKLRDDNDETMILMLTARDAI